MNFRKSLAGFGLAAVALTLLAPTSASARYAHPIRYAHPVRTQRHHAMRLDRQAARAAYNGNYRRATRLRHHATRLRTAARHGY